MKKILIAVITLFCLSSIAHAGDFCKGYKAGYAAQKGRSAPTPPCPASPPTPAGSTQYDEGLKAGIKDARKR